MPQPILRQYAHIRAMLLPCSCACAAVIIVIADATRRAVSKITFAAVTVERRCTEAAMCRPAYIVLPYARLLAFSTRRQFHRSRPRFRYIRRDYALLSAYLAGVRTRCARESSSHRPRYRASESERLAHNRTLEET